MASLLAQTGTMWRPTAPNLKLGNQIKREITPRRKENQIFTDIFRMNLSTMEIS